MQAITLGLCQTPECLRNKLSKCLETNLILPRLRCYHPKVQTTVKRFQLLTVAGTTLNRCARRPPGPCWVARIQLHTRRWQSALDRRLAVEQNERFSITFRDSFERTPQNRFFLAADSNVRREATRWRATHAPGPTVRHCVPAHGLHGEGSCESGFGRYRKARSAIWPARAKAGDVSTP